MTNTKAELEILKGMSNEVLVIKEHPSDGISICETKEENTIYDASIIYEF
jgi:hypothetical protein